MHKMTLRLKKILNLGNKNLLKEITILVSVALVITVIWFRQGVLYGGGESGLYFSDLNLTLKQTLSLWIDSYLGVPLIYQVNNLPFYFFSYFISSLGIPGWLVQAFFHFILISMGMLSMYALVKITIAKEFRFKYLALFAGLFYFLNPYSMSQVWGRGLYMQFVPFASLPLMLLLITLALEKSKLIFILLLLVVSFIFSIGFTPAYVLTFWIMIIAVFGYYLIIYRKSLQKFLKLISFFIVLLVGWSLVHSWWLVHYFILGNSLYLANESVTNEGLGTLMAVSKYSPFTSVIRLLQDGIFTTSWLFGDFYSSATFKVISWIIPFFLIFSIPLMRKSKYLVYWGMLLVVALFICLGAGFPLGFLFVWLFNHFPVLQLFRNPYEKFGIILLISYTPFIALGFFKFSNILSRHYHKFGKCLAGLTAVTIFFVLIWPMWTGLVVTTKKNINFVSIPDYYQNFKDWLKQNNKESNRIFMLPFMPGPGVTLSWDGRTYSGADPSINFLDYSIISWVQDFPYTRPLLSEIYKDISKFPISSMMGLLRAKYLVIRDDVIEVDKRDSKQEENILNFIYSPNDTNDKMINVCSDQLSTTQHAGSLVFACQIPQSLSDWSKYRYLHLLIKTDKPAVLDIALRDQIGHRPRWVYTSNSTYYQTTADWTELIIDLNLPVYGDKDFNPSQVFLLEILARPYSSDEGLLPVAQVQLETAYLDEGKKIEVDDYQFINQFGKLRLYQLKKYVDFSEVSIPVDIKVVDQFMDMFKEAADLVNVDGKVGFILKTQNNSFTSFSSSPMPTKVITKKYSQDKYLVGFEDQGNQYIVLNKTFNLWWKVIPNVSDQDLDGNIFSDINLLRKQSLEENSHFVVNGYANLWKIEGFDKEYAVVFLPQILVNILLKISLAVLSLIVVIIIAWLVKRYYSRFGKISL